MLLTHPPSRPPSALELELLIDRCNPAARHPRLLFIHSQFELAMARQTSAAAARVAYGVTATRCFRPRHVPLTISGHGLLLSHHACPPARLAIFLDSGLHPGPRYGPCWPTIYPSMPQHAGKLALSHGPASPTLPPALGPGRTRDFLWADRIQAPSLTRLPSTRRARLSRSSLRVCGQIPR